MIENKHQSCRLVFCDISQNKMSQNTSERESIWLRWSVWRLQGFVAFAQMRFKPASAVVLQSQSLLRYERQLKMAGFCRNRKSYRIVETADPKKSAFGVVVNLNITTADPSMPLV